MIWGGGEMSFFYLANLLVSFFFWQPTGEFFIPHCKKSMINHGDLLA